MENTLENKMKFFALYYGQEVMKEQGKRQINTYTVSYLDYDKSNHWLELTTLLSITDEDAMKLAKIGLPERIHDYLWSYQTGRAIAKSIQEGRQTNTYYPFFRMGDAFDFLRSKGYAVDWLGLPVQKQIEYGWIKLKNKEESK